MISGPDVRGVTTAPRGRGRWVPRHRIASRTRASPMRPFTQAFASNRGIDQPRKSGHRIGHELKLSCPILLVVWVGPQGSHDPIEAPHPSAPSRPSLHRTRPRTRPAVLEVVRSDRWPGRHARQKDTDFTHRPIELERQPRMADREAEVRAPRDPLVAESNMGTTMRLGQCIRPKKAVSSSTDGNRNAAEMSHIDSSAC